MAIKINRYVIWSEPTPGQQKFLDQHYEGHALIDTGAGTPKVLYIDPTSFTPNEILLIDILFTPV